MPILNLLFISPVTTAVFMNAWKMIRTVVEQTYIFSIHMQEFLQCVQMAAIFLVGRGMEVWSIIQLGSATTGAALTLILLEGQFQTLTLQNLSLTTTMTGASPLLTSPESAR